MGYLQELLSENGNLKTCIDFTYFKESGGVHTLVSQENLRMYYKCGHLVESQSGDSRAQFIVESPKAIDADVYVPGSDSEIFSGKVSRG